MNVSEIMTEKVTTVGLDYTLGKLRDLFEKHKFHHVLVVEKRRLKGVVSDRDLLRNVSPFVEKMAERTQDIATLKRRVHQIMTRKPVIATREMSVEDAAKVMLERRVSCLPVVTEKGYPLGIVTWRDMLRGLCGGEAA